ncbi:hypothetical protein B0H14DRAFT_2567596 [Mycena olivaceomarginata]|nr:hypothetical protein B0H14DRAFT_2567596 [Mycena olivaceomarginata]
MTLRGRLLYYFWLPAALWEFDRITIDSVQAEQAILAYDSIERKCSECSSTCILGHRFLNPGCGLKTVRFSVKNRMMEAAAVCQAVDTVMGSLQPLQNGEMPQHPVNRVFVAIRPPGHHCGEDTPSGFCFVKNAALGAAHGTVSACR